MDPEADEFGIFLVFWFGADRIKLSPEGLMPTTPQELVEMLSIELSDQEKWKTGICVIDVSPPD